MEKNTLMAIVLSVVVLLVFYVFFAPSPAPPRQVAHGEWQPPVEAPPPVGLAADRPADQFVPPAGEDIIAGILGTAPAVTVPRDDAVPDAVAGPGRQEVTVETDFLTVVLSNAGGNIVSFRLNNRLERVRGEDPRPVEMIFRGDGSRAFTLAFGGPNSTPVTSYFNVEHTTDPATGRHLVRFYQNFDLHNDPALRFQLAKEYTFHPGEYMFQLDVSLTAERPLAFDFNGIAYTLSFGPQIGPPFQRLDRRHDNRQYFYFDGRRRRTVRRPNAAERIANPRWGAIAGQYFTLIAIPHLHGGGFSLSFCETRGIDTDIYSTSRMHIIRPALTAMHTRDTFHFYLGPRSMSILRTYDRGESVFVGASGMQLDEMAGSRGFLAPLERVLLFFLNVFYGMTRNYGVAIILLTLLVRIAFFPLSKKGVEATMRMQEFAPKIKELQEKYKDNRQKLNMEMAELYKKGGYNPLKGCLPMLLQLPIFFAMFNLFRTHFELRGAMFIPGWIPDLSVPEYIVPFGVSLPLLGWDALRLLPFIYAGSQLLYGRVTQQPGQKGNPQMKIIMYAMPIVFFFILYDMPSGLLVYWTSSNVLTMVQQVAIMKYLSKKKAAQAAEAPPSIAPKKKNSPQAGNSQSNVIAPRKRKKR